MTTNTENRTRTDCTALTDKPPKQQQQVASFFLHNDSDNLPRPTPLHTTPPTDDDLASVGDRERCEVKRLLLLWGPCKGCGIACGGEG
ncbi:hypothetical protein BaRGS_00031135 [Batillaria attramentaria]|uniref:Uncharacterized protein n=1 Tax=Batillaria attramentaria TaxID=370345 RepID=A0ABD0JS02_9CAEN